MSAVDLAEDDIDHLPDNGISTTISAETTVFFPHWSLVPLALWRWPNFSPREIASKGDGSLLVHTPSLDTLQRAREIAGKPFHISSAYRDPVHNALVGGVPLSQHLYGRAFDVSLRGHDGDELVEALRGAGFTGFGLSYKTFVHADTGRPREW